VPGTWSCQVPDLKITGNSPRANCSILKIWITEVYGQLNVVKSTNFQFHKLFGRKWSVTRLCCLCVLFFCLRRWRCWICWHVFCYFGIYVVNMFVKLLRSPWGITETRGDLNSAKTLYVVSVGNLLRPWLDSHLYIYAAICRSLQWFADLTQLPAPIWSHLSCTWTKISFLYKNIFVLLVQYVQHKLKM
jgi:hypothetical protein